MSWRPIARGLLCAILAQAVLMWNTGAVLQESRETLLDRQSRRYWEDLALAIGYFKTGQSPVGFNAAQRWTDEEGVTYYKERGGVITTITWRAGLSPWRFWQVLPPRVAPRLNVDLYPRFDDVGRSLLLGEAFKALGGIAPFLLFWMGALLLFPVLAWITTEIDLSGRPVGALFTALGLSVSAYFGDALALAYSTAGYYSLAVLLLAAFSAATVLRTPSLPALLWKSLAAGLYLGLLVACRSGALLLIPGFLVAALVAARRLPQPRRLAGWAASCALLVLPAPIIGHFVEGLTETTFAARGQSAAIPQHHAVWFGLWAGLGDFDTEKGYVWSDGATSAFMVRHGGTPLGPASYDPRNEDILRDAILADVFSDPPWYLGILIKRMGATLTQWYILPWRPLSGRATRDDENPNGSVASYYSLTSHVDVARVYPFEAEFPFLVLILSTLTLLLKPGRVEALFLVPVALGAMVLPVLITTAGAIEPMAFGLVYVLGTALAVETGSDLAWRRPRPAEKGEGGVDRRP